MDLSFHPLLLDQHRLVALFSLSALALAGAAFLFGRALLHVI
jgi:hypothetical protein